MSGLSKEEYLKRYLSPQDGGVAKKKKKRRKKNTIGKGLRIFDDDVSWSEMASKDDNSEDELVAEEDKPQVEVIDNRTEEEKRLDEYRKTDRWKTLDNANSNTDQDMDRKARHDSDSDLEVYRRPPRHDSDSDLDVSRKPNNRHDSDSDLDVSRKPSNRHDSDSDLDVPRNGNDQSDSDMDVPRAKRSDDSDLEIPRKVNTKQQMSSGGRGGLTSRKDLKEEIKKRQKNSSAFDDLASETKENATVFRVKGGKKRDLAKEKQVQDDKEAVEQEKMNKYSRWGKGVVQTNLQSEARSDLIHESNKPLARYADDKDLDKLQREVMRDGDPMANYIKQKKQKEVKTRFPKYQGPQPAPNRYQIEPGYRWDGVDRSNGFERKYFESINNKSTHNEEAYKWSVEDM